MRGNGASVSRAVLRLAVVTPDGVLFQGAARSLRLPATDGSIGVLPRHAPMIAVLRCGVLRVVHGDGEPEQMAIGDGYAQVHPTQVRLVVSFLNSCPDVDQDRAHGAMQRAIDRLEEQSDGFDVVRAVAALCRALVRLRVCGCGCDLCRCHQRMAR